MIIAPQIHQISEVTCPEKHTVLINPHTVTPNRQQLNLILSQHDFFSPQLSHLIISTSKERRSSAGGCVGVGKLS